MEPDFVLISRKGEIDSYRVEIALRFKKLPFKVKTLEEEKLEISYDTPKLLTNESTIEYAMPIIEFIDAIGNNPLLPENPDLREIVLKALSKLDSIHEDQIKEEFDEILEQISSSLPRGFKIFWFHREIILLDIFLFTIIKKYPELKMYIFVDLWIRFENLKILPLFAAQSNSTTHQSEPVENYLDYFKKAQDPQYERVKYELSKGNKRSHWIWYFFPILLGLRPSIMSRKFGIKNIEMAEDYMQHSVLRNRLLECTELLMNHPQKSLTQIFGEIDSDKVVAWMTLFERVSSTEPIFSKVLEIFNEGKRDEDTLKMLDNN